MNIRKVIKIVSRHAHQHQELYYEKPAGKISCHCPFKLYLDNISRVRIGVQFLMNSGSISGGGGKKKVAVVMKVAVHTDASTGPSLEAPYLQ